MNLETQALVESLLSQMNGAALAAARREAEFCAQIAVLRTEVVELKKLPAPATPASLKKLGA